jgi:hypothetical protein
MWSSRIVICSSRIVIRSSRIVTLKQQGALRYHSTAYTRVAFVSQLAPSHVLKGDTIVTVSTVLFAEG